MVIRRGKKWIHDMISQCKRFSNNVRNNLRTSKAARHAYRKICKQCLSREQVASVNTIICLDAERETSLVLSRSRLTTKVDELFLEIPERSHYPYRTLEKGFETISSRTEQNHYHNKNFQGSSSFFYPTAASIRNMW